MRTNVLTTLLALLVALVPVAARADLKLGFVDLQRALNEVDEGKSAKSQLEKEFKEKQKQLDSKQDELKRLKADYDKQALVMAEQVKRDKQADLERKAQETQQLYVQLQSELSRREQEITKGIFEKMAAIVREIAEAEGFTMIFERNGSGLLYAPTSLDVTNELIRKYNSRFAGGAAAKKPEPKAAAPAAPAAPTPAAAKK
jgi:outer membrane protein